jgi:hypothetical protein
MANLLEKLGGFIILVASLQAIVTAHGKSRLLIIWLRNMG